MIQVGIAEIDACACAEASMKLALLIEFVCSDVQQIGDDSRKRLKAREESANQVFKPTVSFCKNRERSFFFLNQRPIANQNPLSAAE